MQAAVVCELVRNLAANLYIIADREGESVYQA